MRLESHLKALDKTIGRRTLSGYRSIARAYLVPYFGGKPLWSAPRNQYTLSR